MRIIIHLRDESDGKIRTIISRCKDYIASPSDDVNFHNSMVWRFAMRHHETVRWSDDDQLFRHRKLPTTARLMVQRLSHGRLHDSSNKEG